MTDEIHSYVTTLKRIENNSGKLEELLRSWEKTCGLGPTEERTPLERIVEKINDAPEQLKYLN